MSDSGNGTTNGGRAIGNGDGAVGTLTKKDLDRKSVV